MKTFKFISRTALLAFVLMLFSYCTQIKQMLTFLNCDFRIASVSNVSMLGIDLSKIHSFSDFSLMDGAKLISSVGSGTLPLDLTVNVEARNPNQQKASFNKLDWILLIDDLEMAQGSTVQRVEIEPNNATALFPVAIRSDLAKILSGRSAKNIVNFGLNLAGVGNSVTRVALKAKPTILIGSSAIEYPGYITIKKDFVSH
jgi:hypothetical protein